jgi:hypothetical protein
LGPTVNHMRHRVLKAGRSVFALGLFVLLGMLAGCGGGGSGSGTSSAGPSLKGNYVFSVVGSDPNDGDYAVVGSFVGDGNGHITSGVADYNLGSGIDANVPLTGSYIQSGSSLTIKLTDGMMVDDSFTTTLASSGTSPIENFDSSGSGTLYPQSASGFTPIGAYSYTVEGEEQGTLTGSGQLVVGPGDTFTGGIFSETDGGTEMQYQSVSGFIYPPNAAGRGQAAVEGNNMSYYVISPTQIEMIGLDERALLLIPAQKQ